MLRLFISLINYYYYCYYYYYCIPYNFTTLYFYSNLNAQVLVS